MYLIKHIEDETEKLNRKVQRILLLLIVIIGDFSFYYSLIDRIYIISNKFNPLSNKNIEIC